MSDAPLFDGGGREGAASVDASATNDRWTFRDAIAELESILRRIENEETDLDSLGEELRRATELLEICRAKVRRAEVEVREIVARIDEPAAGAAED